MGGMTHNYMDSCISEINYLLESYVSDKERVEHFSRSRATYFRYKRKFFSGDCQPKNSAATYYRRKKHDLGVLDSEWHNQVIEKKKQYHASHKKEDDARSQVGKALKAKKIVKPLGCEICGKVRQLLGHHSDYDKPLSVTWCCKSCHGRLHHSV